jgi:hypothetical protein
LVKKATRLERDVFFIGKEKGRSNDLKKIENRLINLGLSSLFYITANHPRLRQKKYKKHIPYEKVLDYVNESKAILDYYVDPHAGLSLRAMESIFFEKKLITNNQTISEYDFFNPENIFVLEKRNIGELKNFVDAPYVKISKSKKDKYSFEEWINRFFIES